MSKEIIHALILVGTVVISFILPKSNLAQYDLQISASLFIILFLAKKYFVPKTPQSRLIESVIFTLITLSIINTTGGVESPFFFLIYFLLFSLSLLLEPIIPLTTTITLVIFFLTSLLENQGLKQILPIISLAFLTPFAMFMGQEFEENQKSKIKDQRSKTEIYLFLSLILKNHLKNIKNSIENFVGDHQLHEIKTNAHKMEKLIEEFESKN